MLWLFADGGYSVGPIIINEWAAGIIAGALTTIGRLFYTYIRDNQNAAIAAKNEYKEMMVANTALTREVATALVAGAKAVEGLSHSLDDLKNEIRFSEGKPGEPAGSNNTAGKSP